MKKLNKTLALGSSIFLLLLASIVGQTQSHSVVLGSPGTQEQKVTLLSDLSDKISLKFNLNEINFNEVVTDYGIAQTINSKKAPNIQEKGCPDLLYLTASVIIPELGNTSVEVIPGDYVEFFNIEVAPSKGILTRDVNPNLIPYEKGKVYKNDEFFPGQLAQLREPYILRDFRGQTVEVFPVQYNPVTKTLRVYKEIVVNIHSKNERGANELIDSRKNLKVYSEFDKIYRRNFLNYSTRAKYTPVGEEGRLIVVAHSTYMDAMKPFVNWKNQKGQPTTLVNYTDIGGSAATLTTYIADQYNSEAGLMFVLLVGDGSHVHTIQKTLTGTSPSPAYCDPAYGFITGNDAYAEVFIGRFSAESLEDVQTQVNRVITYERDLTTADTWLKNGMGLASSEGGGSQGDNGESDIQHMNIIRGKLLNFNYTSVDQVYDPGATAATVVTNLNQGRGIANYVGHGSDTYWVTSGFGLNNMSSLTNVNKLPFVFDVACVNGRFVGQNCFAEGFVRSRKPEGPTGAIAIIAGSINQSWNSPMRGQDEMNDILVESYSGNIKRTFGGITVNGCMNMNDVYGTDGYNMTNTWVIFGDPSMVIRTNTPAEMTVTHNPTIFLGATTFSVSCDTDGAIAAVSYIDGSDNVVLVGKGTVESGSATISFENPIVTPVDLIITVTGYNKQTYTGTISAVPADEPYVVLKSFATTALPNYGQQIGINIELENISDAPYTATDVTATISTESEYVSILSGYAQVGTIDPDQVVSINDLFEISIANNVPNQTALLFTITITGSYNGENYEWSQNFSIKANAPVLTIGGLTIEDGGTGIPGILDPGETASAEIAISNTGAADATDLQAALSTASPYVTLGGTNPLNLGSLAAGASTSASFEVTASGDTPLETAAAFTVTATAGEYAASKELSTVIGYIPEYPMSSTPVTACIGKFYDSGGANGQYANSENFTKTFYPTSTNSILAFTFTSFDVESGYDYLYIYNGPSTSSPLIGTYSGTNSPGTIFSTHETGAITFKFTSDGVVVKNGWQANFSCITLTDPPACAGNPYPADGTVGASTGLTLSWDVVLGSNAYDVYLGAGTLPAEPTATVATNSYVPEGLTPGTHYVWRVVPKNGVGPATGCATWGFITGLPGGTVLMHTGTVSTCNSLFYDTGGASGSYNNSENHTLTVNPGVEGARVRVTFLSFEVESNTGCTYDHLKVYDGASTEGTLLGTFCGTALPGPFTSTTGSLTFLFKSDGSVVKAGWSAQLSCVDVPADEYAVTFTVTDGTDALAGATIAIGGGTLTTDATGGASLNLPVGFHAYTVTAEGYEPQSGTVAVASEPVSVAVVLNPAVTTYTVSFVVTTTDEQPLAGATIAIGGEELTTDAAGAASIALVPGTYAYTVTHADCHAHEGSLEVTDHDMAMPLTLVPTGIGSEALAGVQLYPNPFGDRIVIAGADRVRSVAVHSILGQPVLRAQHAGGPTLEVGAAQLPAGVYLVTLTGEGGATRVARMVKR